MIQARVAGRNGDRQGSPIDPLRPQTIRVEGPTEQTPRFQADRRFANRGTRNSKRLASCCSASVSRPETARQDGFDDSFVYELWSRPRLTGLMDTADQRPQDQCQPMQLANRVGSARRWQRVSRYARSSERGPDTVRSIARHGAAYRIAVGGAAYLVSKVIKSARVVAFDDLGKKPSTKSSSRTCPSRSPSTASAHPSTKRDRHAGGGRR